MKKTDHDGSARLVPPHRLLDLSLIRNEEADEALVAWGHWLGKCNRPFGRESYGLHVDGLGLVAVAVSASTVNKTCAGFPRGEVVELARLCSRPDQRWATRPMLRLWREVAAPRWPHWPTRAFVSYSDATRHTGDIYRFDGWTRVAETRGGTTGKNAGWSRAKRIAPKVVWAWTRQPILLAAQLVPGARP